MGKAKSPEWKAKIRALNEARRLTRATPEQQETFNHLFGTQITNWEEIPLQNNRKANQHTGWPRLRSTLKFACTKCGRGTTKVMTPDLLDFQTRTCCRSCAGGVGVSKPCDQMNTPQIRAKVQQSFNDAKRGPGTPENTHIRQQIEAVLGATVTNWEGLEFSRYGNPVKNSHLEFICTGCQKPSVVTFVSVDDLPNHCQRCTINASFSGTQRSGPEQEIEAYLRSLGVINIQVGQRTIIPPLELDLYLPDYALAIEYHGLYWHSMKNKFYHLNKLRACEKQGIRLIQIFEDEWIDKGDIVRLRLAHILGKKTDARIHGRKCEIREIAAADSKTFLGRQHIQGYGSSSEQYGAFHDGRLVAVMTFRPGRTGVEVHGKDWWILNRFAVDGNIPGIASRLLKAFREKHPATSVVSYADRRWSAGGVYERMGFTMLHETEPQYWYVMGLQRLHKSSFKKKNLTANGFDQTMSESEIMKEAGYRRVYDCGTLVYRLDP